MTRSILSYFFAISLTLLGAANDGVATDLRLSGKITNAPLESVLQLLQAVDGRNFFYLGLDNPRVSCNVESSTTVDILSCLKESLHIESTIGSSNTVILSPAAFAPPPALSETNERLVSLQLHNVPLSAVYQILGEELTEQSKNIIVSAELNDVPRSYALELLRRKYASY